MAKKKYKVTLPEVCESCHSMTHLEVVKKLVGLYETYHVKVCSACEMRIKKQNVELEKSRKRYLEIQERHGKK